MRLPSPSHPAVLKNTWQIGHRKFNVKKVPVFRVENKNVVSANYRPVSLASTAAKSLDLSRNVLWEELACFSEEPQPL